MPKPLEGGSLRHRIAQSGVHDYYRQRKNQVELKEVDQAQCGRTLPLGSHSYEAEVALEAIRRLPEAYRETLMLRLVEGMTGPEIAARTNLTPDSVRVNLCRGMKLLRAQLGDKGSHE